MSGLVSGLWPAGGPTFLSVLGRTLAPMPRHSGLDEWVAHIEHATVAGVDAALRESGFVQSPTVYLLAEDLNPPLVGYLTCRRFYRGTDAEVAVAAMGVLPAALAVNRLVVRWEHADLCTALELPGPDEGFPPGVVVVDADRHGHVVNWHPMRLRVDESGSAGLPTIVPEWGPVTREVGGELPIPVQRLLEVWRNPGQWSDTELLRVLTSLEQSGYSMRWVQRDVSIHDPDWAQLLAPMMA